MITREDYLCSIKIQTYLSGCFLKVVKDFNNI